MDGKYHILIVEDDRIERMLLHGFLKNEYIITEAENGKVALQMLQAGDPADLIISDLMMPEMDGKQLLAELGKIHNLREFPVLIATGAEDKKEDDDVELECLELGCSDFIHKPYNPKLLKMRVENTIERMEYSRLKQNRIKDTFGKFVDPNVVNELLETDPSQITQSREITVLFADIRNFTTISENMSPLEVLELLNRCFDITSSCIKKYGGVLDKYIGDCTMAFWGAPDDCEDSAYLACRAAMEMLEQTENLFKSYSDEYGVEVSLGIGINKGQAIAGNVGSSERMNYTVVGDAVNVASRLEGVAQANEILIGKSVYKTLDDRIVTEETHECIVLKGKSKPVTVRKIVLEN